MTEEEFVSNSVRMQIGEFRGPISQSEEAMIRAMEGSSGGALSQTSKAFGSKIIHMKEGHIRNIAPREMEIPSKNTNALREISSYLPTLGLTVDMQDRRIRSLADAGAPTWPTFCFNRLAGDRQRVLWPLPFYHDIDGRSFLANVQPDAVPWSDKASRVVWRGNTGGRAMGTSPRTEGIRLKGMLRRQKKGGYTDEKLLEDLLRLPRYSAVFKTQHDSRFDFGFVIGGREMDIDKIKSKIPHHAHLTKPRLSHIEMQRCKYIAVLRGLDVGSSFYWVMNSGSVGFVMDTPFETFASSHFTPWMHYIPIREDCADLEEKFEWAERHPEECREMTERAAKICRLLAREDLRATILHEVTQKIYSMERA